MAVVGLPISVVKNIYPKADPTVVTAVGDDTSFFAVMRNFGHSYTLNIPSMLLQVMVLMAVNTTAAALMAKTSYSMFLWEPWRVMLKQEKWILRS